MKNMKKSRKTKGVEVSKDGITVYMPEAEYDYIYKIAKEQYKDERLVKGLINTYAVIWGYSFICPHIKMVPIYRQVFRTAASSHHYIDHQQRLQEKNIIQIQKARLCTIINVRGFRCISTESPKCYRLNTMAHMFSKDIFYNNEGDRLIPVKLKFSAPELVSFKMKRELVQKAVDYFGQPDKMEKLMSISDKEVYATSLTTKLIIDLLEDRLHDPERFKRRVREIAQHYMLKDTLKTKEYVIATLTLEIVKIIGKGSDKKIGHIGGSYLTQSIDNKLVAWTRKRRNENGKLAYYKDLKVDQDALNYCIRMTDLFHIARINEVPKYHYPDKKVYSKLASLRKPLRRFVRYKGSRLVEVSDVHSAHFTMLPAIFEKEVITIPQDESDRFRNVTQKNDLYAEVVKGTGFTRDEIKKVFQPFFSIKNENQFLHAQYDEYEMRQLICDYFKANFPATYCALLGFHTDHKDRSIKRVANEVESEIMNDICDELRQSGLHPFRIHDAIYLPEDESKLLTININEEVYKRINHTDKPLLPLAMVNPEQNIMPKFNH